MPQEVYEVVAQGARYWFFFLMIVIAWRSYRWLMKDRKMNKKRMRLLPDAGFIGEMILQNSVDPLHEGDTLSVPQEGVLGALRSCDLYLPVKGVAKQHLWYRYEPGKGLAVRTFFKCRAAIDGTETSRWKDTYMFHGSYLVVGNVVMRLRMFVGYEVMPDPKVQAHTQVVESSAAEQLDAVEIYDSEKPGEQETENEESKTIHSLFNPFEPLDEDFYEPIEEYDAQESLESFYSLEQSVSQDAEMEDIHVIFDPKGEDFNEPDAALPEGEYEWPETDEAPKSEYVGHDEAERAKRVLWDKYLGGGPKR